MLLQITTVALRRLKPTASQPSTKTGLLELQRTRKFDHSSLT